MASANLIITRILMILPSVSLGFLLGPMVKITGVLSPGNNAHPPGGHAVFTFSPIHIALRTNLTKSQVSGLQIYPKKKIESDKLFRSPGRAASTSNQRENACNERELYSRTIGPPGILRLEFL
jgi:hypothetical protein